MESKEQKLIKEELPLTKDETKVIEEKPPPTNDETNVITKYICIDDISYQRMWMHRLLKAR